MTQRTPVEGIDYEIQVSQTQETVWINGADGSSIGRFSKRFGMDIHNSASAQMAGTPECIHCTHEQADRQTWETFVSKIRTYFGIEVDADLLSF